jgi:hypothetical protein
MTEEDARGVSDSDADLIVKADIDELTKALGEFSKSVESLNKSLASHFSKLVDEQPQSIGGKGHSVTNTMQKSDEGQNFSKAEMTEDMNAGFENISKAYDAKILALEEKISKMESEVIKKGASAVIIPEQVSKDDPYMSNMSIFEKFGRTAQ